LWDLGILFGVITGGYFLVILILQHRIAGRRRQIRLRKGELAPVITKFLFFQQEIDLNGREDYIRMKIEIRDQLKAPVNRVVLTEVLMDLRQDVTGEARKRLLNLYQDLGLHQDALQKLQSVRWEKVSQGILELTEMRVDQAYHIIKKRINDKRSVVRRQAQLAIVNLREEGIRYVLDTARHRISEWQQLKLMELLNQKEDFIPPRFQAWLISENEDVVLFALRLIRHYRQSDASKAIVTLIRHRSPEIQVAALECIREFRFKEARTPLKQNFENATARIKISILDALREVATEEDLPWLQTQAIEDPSFLVRNKAGMVLNELMPESVLPTKDIRPLPEPGDVTREEEGSITSPTPDPTMEIGENMEGRVPASTGLPRADFGEIQIDPDWAPEWLLSNEIRLPVAEINLRDLPEEEWTPQHERIFAHCFLEELEEILSTGPASIALPEVSLDFLPIITEKPKNTTHMLPHESIPDWLRKLDVQAEILSADSGYAKVLREILLEDLAETGEVFSTDFVPWVTGAGVGEEAISEKEMDPDFGVIAGDIQQIHSNAQVDPPPVESEEGAPLAQASMNYFSIFQEYFRSYDQESKLILLDEIPEMGTEEELPFLEGLFEDSDEKIAKRARKVYALLARRLKVDPKALEAKGSQTLWKPSSASAKKRTQEKEKTRPRPGMDGRPSEEEFAFIPEFDAPPGLQKQRTRKPHRRKNRLFRFFGGPQKGADE
jgi:HEAT repeat protein